MPDKESSVFYVVVLHLYKNFARVPIIDALKNSFLNHLQVEQVPPEQDLQLDLPARLVIRSGGEDEDAEESEELL
jgi:hypothetical protein